MRISFIAVFGVIAVILTAGAALAADPFNPSVLHEVRIVIDPADWQALRDNYRDNQYYAANVAIDGEVVEQIGIRSRGQGSRNPDKPGIKLDFNKYIKTQTFHGYKAIDLDNLLQDASGLRERLAMSVFEAMGIPAPQEAHARVTVNEQYWGLYGFVEEIREVFLQKYAGESNGNLFKYEWAYPYIFNYLGGDAASYVPSPFEPKIHEDDVDATGLVSFIQKTNDAPDETFIADISAYVDVEKILSYAAVEIALAESDGILGKQGLNNFYLYQYAGRDFFVFYPWDKDTSFTSAEWPLFNNVEANVLVRRLLSFPAQRDLFLGAVKRAVQSFVNPRWLTPRLETAYQQIRNAMLLDTHKPTTNDEFESTVVGLRAIIAGREADVLQQIQDVSSSSRRRR